MIPWAMSVTIRPIHRGWGACGADRVSHHGRSRFARRALVLDEADVAGLASRLRKPISIELCCCYPLPWYGRLACLLAS